MPYGFRLRLKLSNHQRVQLTSRLELLTPEDVVPVIVLVSPDEAVAEPPELLVRCEGIATEAEAHALGERTRDLLAMAFTRLRIGADVQDRRHGSFTRYILERAAVELGRPILNDHQGLAVFESFPPPAFVPAGGGTVTVLTPIRSFVSAFRWAYEERPAFTERLRLASELFSASQFGLPGDARLITLVMAVEALIDPLPRSPAAQEHVAKLIKATGSARLDERERNSLVGTLKWCLSESINQAGRRLASHLGDKPYLGLTPPRFFSRCYEVRSALVHGRVPRPAPNEVGDLLAPLEEFVSDLIISVATRRNVSAPEPPPRGPASWTSRLAAWGRRRFAGTRR